MSKNLPAAIKETPLVHSPLVPAWEDEFDLRIYFACIHPTQYELKDRRECGLAKQILGAVQVCTVNWVGIYRAILAAHRKHPNVLVPALLCIGSVLRREVSSHLTWYGSPQTEFGGKTPGDWFCDQGVPELGERLRFHGPVDQADVLEEVLLRANRDSKHSGPLFRRTVVEAEMQLSSEHRELREIVRMLYSAEHWEDEFDFAPHLALWSPANYILDNPTNFQVALELYEFIRAEFAGWVRLYRAALEVGCQRAGVLQGVAICVMKVVGGGRRPYLEWFETPQTEFFDGTSPKQWFVDQKLEELGHLLSLGNSHPGETN